MSTDHSDKEALSAPQARAATGTAAIRVGKALRFFNALTGKLKMEFSESVQRDSRLMNGNYVPSPSAKLVDARLELMVREDNYFRTLTREEWNQVALRAPRIRMRGLSGNIVEHAAPNGTSFKVGDLAAAVEETERQGRGDSEWFGCIDVHHAFFEGLELGDDGAWEICWGS